MSTSAQQTGETSKPPCYLSIDFEDFSHDFQRSLGIVRPRRTPDSLWHAYVLIERFSRAALEGKRITFFTTGQVARDYPDLVRRIADDGHEIACHYYEHDQIWHQDRDTMRRNLGAAIEVLTKASGQKITGFRAPDFAIDDRCASWAFEELSRRFLYDSSRVAARHSGPPHSPTRLEYSSTCIYEFPIYQKGLVPGFAVRVIGGTYFRILPASVILKWLKEAWVNGFLPQVYLHPYDLLYSREQWSTYADLAELPFMHRLYWSVRQHQWHSIGNTGAFDKLERIFAVFSHPGPLASALPEAIRVE